MMLKFESCNNFLSEISYLLENREFSWAITGSYCLYLHGYDIKPNDIDIICDKEFCKFLEFELPTYITRNFAYSKHDVIYSYFGELFFEGKKIQLMSEVWNRDTYNIWHYNDYWKKQILIKKIGNYRIPILSVDHELYISKLKGSHSRVRLIHSNRVKENDDKC